jgi:hypothetical protein
MLYNSTKLRIAPAIAIVAAALATAAPAHTADAADAAREDKAATTATDPRAPKITASTRICHLGAHSGSRVPKKVCRTKAEWEAKGVDIEAAM